MITPDTDLFHLTQKSNSKLQIVIYTNRLDQMDLVHI